MRKCDLCGGDIPKKITMFVVGGFVFAKGSFIVVSPPSLWGVCDFCKYCIDKGEKEVLLEHCATKQCIGAGERATPENMKSMRDFLRPMHKAFFEKMSSPMAN